MEIIRVIIADDHVIFRKGLATILNEVTSVKVVAEASNGHEVLDYLKSGAADVILMDIKMPGMDGIEATKKITAAYPDVNIIGLTMHEEISYFKKMIEAGARGFLLKKTTRDQLEEAINAVYGGENYFAEEFSINIQSVKPGKNSVVINLSDREKEVLEYICKGYSNVEIAKKLGVSQRTIDGHRSRLFEKTGARNAPNLVLFAIRNGLVKP